MLSAPEAPADPTFSLSTSMELGIATADQSTASAGGVAARAVAEKRVLRKVCLSIQETENLSEANHG